MKKLVIFITALIVIISLSIVFILTWLNSNKQVKSDALAAIPLNASVILKIDNLPRFSERLRSNNMIWLALKEIPGISSADKLIGFIDSLSQNQPTFYQVISANPIFFAVQPDSKKHFDMIASVSLQKHNQKKQLLHILKLFGNIKTTTKDFEGSDIYSVSMGKNQVELMHFSIENGLLICSNSFDALKSSLRQLKENKSVKDIEAFKSIIQTAGNNVEASLFINHKYVPPILAPLLNLPYQQEINSLTDLSQWTALDISLKSEALCLSGFSNPSPEKGSYLSIFTRQTPIETTITSILPAETSAFFWLGISDLNTYLEDYRSYLNQQVDITGYTNNLGKIKITLGTDIHELFNNIFNKEIALVQVPFDGVDQSACWFIVTRLKSVSQAEQTFVSIIESYSKTNGLKFSDFIFRNKIDKETTSTFYHFPIKGVHSSLFGSMFSPANDAYFTFIDDFVVFGASVDVLNKFVMSNIHNNLLGIDLSYTQLKDVQASSSNYYIYLNPDKSQLLIDQFINDQYLPLFKNHHQTLGKIQGLVIQLSGGSNMIFNNIGLKYSPQVTEEPKAAWETKLDTCLLGKPIILINHYTRNKEIFVQDYKYNIYLINEVGRVLWKKSIPEPILGEVEQIDLFKNGKLQMVFNTGSKIYIIDRNGNNVDGFPVKLKAKATNPISVFDYEQSRDYRFFVACDNNHVYAFDNKGKPLTGWNFRKTEQKVTGSIQHFRIKGIDYIVFADKNRVYVVDRKGTEKVRYKQNFSISPNSQFVLEEKSLQNPPRFAATDTLGIIHYFYLDGRVEEKPIKPFSSSHFFDYQDVDSDDEKDFILLDGNTLSVYRQNLEILFNYKFDVTLIPKVIYFNFGTANKKLGVSSQVGNEVFLINSNGSLYKGFPLKGNGLFSIGRINGQGSFNLIVGSPSGSLLNYEVQ